MDKQEILSSSWSTQITLLLAFNTTDPLARLTSDSKPEVEETRVHVESSVGQDSGISSTSDSTVSYSLKRQHHHFEDLTKVPWYEAEMPR